ncbi:VCBS domain-containing protein [Qipengyuania xiapuensis]|uniref:VCBS domain-containing protein n=1 Tax=Qipengyuania xiapuensis TaxID=2867236 RepID=A0ABX8ZSF0_9SPHN|nr:DUF5801 repeats-in-toxin domain-containing protein [Qipengyuania xiapuensis]QZD91827.1 VCBS domain-containing protein [Qipengyuania xiapuensis]
MDNFESRNEFSDAQDGMENSEGQATATAGRRDLVLQPDANGVVILPEGASLDNLRADGRDLVLVLEDGTRIVIPEGAIIVPQIVFDGVTIPAANLAALLTGNEPQPAAGNPQSSGGNFEIDPGAIQDAFDLGDLLPYTQLFFPEPEEKEVIPYNVNEDPTIVVETPDNPVGVINAVATVDEAGLPARTVDGIDESAGTRDETDAETATGTIVFDAPDGVSAVLINGVEITTVGQTFVSDDGTLTITSIDLDSGEIGFSYTLNDNLVDRDVDGFFTMTVVDVDGDSADASLLIRVIDDAPIANDDVDSVDAGTYGPIAGNVMTGDGTDTGAAGADEEGADGASVTGFSGTGGSGSAGDSIDGDYGTLTLEADGSYTYTRFDDAPGGVSDVFEYTLTDADGSTATATLTIEIGDSTPEITRLPSGDAETLVDEAGLPARTGESEGSDEPADSETVAGTISFVSPDGVDSVEINGVVVTGPGQTFDVGEGTLTITGYDPDAGTITYEFTLEDNTSGDDVSYDVDLTVTDLDGDTATGTFTISVTDDVPTANDDSATQDAEDAPVTVDVFTNDVQGADSVQLDAIALVDGTLTGAGSVAYNGDGTFTYTPAPGEEGTVTFDYSITDGDGDVSTATVTITLLPDSTPEITIEGADIVYESGLGARGSEPAGSDEASDSEFTGGIFNLNTGGDTVASLVINGVDVTGGGTVTTARGVLTVTGSGSDYTYTYELTDNTLSDPDSDTFTMVVTDSDGDTDQTTIVITIVDDSPSAEDDANGIAAGEYGPVGGNVLDNDTQGADGATVTSYTGANGSGSAGDTIQGEYGTLTIEADGSYTYTRDAGTEGGVTDTFSYIITDGDGDTATANLVITIADSPVVLDLPVAGGAGTLVDEAGLPAGSDAASDSEFTAGTFTYDADDGPATVTIDGTPVTAVGQTFTGSFGTLTITSIADGVIGYSYELTTNTSGDDTFDSFAVVVTDQDGDSDAGDLEIAIVDDVPTAVADTDSVTEDGPLTADGNVITDAEANGDNGADTQGADGASVTGVAFGATDGTVGSSLDGAYGSLVLNADGSYTYTLDNTNPLVQGLDSTESLTEVFTYTITDGDGDPSTTTLTITINGADDIVTINGLDLQTPELTVDEDDLADGSSPDAGALVQSGSFTVDSPDGLSVLTVGGVQVWGGGETYPITITGDYGDVRITAVDVTLDANGDVVAATVSYEYELSDNTLDHSVAGEDSLIDSFDVVATDTDGSNDTASLDIEVIDDVPTALDNENTVTEGAQVSGNVITDDNGFGVDVPGADGPITVVGVTGSTGGDDSAPFVVTTALGTLTVQADGSYTYESFADSTNADTTDTFTYQVVDADGDLSTATLVINIDNVGVDVLDDDATVNEAGLATGSDAASDSEIDADGQITAPGATGTLTFTLLSPATGTYGTLTLDSDTGEYTYTLTSAVDGDSLVPSQGGDNGANTVTGQESFDYEVRDEFGNLVGTGTINVNIIDDVPSIDAASTDGDTVTLTTQDADTVGGTDTDVSTADFGGAFTVVSSEYGADGPGSIAWDYSLVVENSVSNLSSDGVPIELTLVGGVVEGRANGTLVFTLSVDASTGEVTLTQYEEIDHALPGSSSNYDAQLAVLGDGLVTLSGTATITDGDGDMADETVTLDLGGNVRFADDGPAIDATVTDGDAVTLTTFDADTVGGTGVDTSTADFGGAFSVASSDYGADGAGSIAWDYSLVIDNAVSGLTSDGVPVELTMNGDVVEGRANGVLVFTVAVDDTTGVVTLTQYEEIDHDLPGAGSNYDSQLEALADGVLSLSGTATITDGDGDTAEETVVLDLGGNIRFADDGPTIDAAVTDGDAVTLTTFDADTVGGTGVDTSTADFGGAFSVASSDYGADGAGSIAWDYSLVIDNATSGLTSDGVPVTLSMNGDVVEGRANGTLVFTVAIDDTTGVVTLTQYEEIDHDLPGSDSNYDSQLEALADGVLSISGTATITDGDGDTAEETVVLDLGGNIRFADDGPTIDASVTDGDTVTLTTQDADTVGGTDTDVSTADFGGAFAVDSSDYGADGAGSIAWDYGLSVVSSASGLTSDGVAIELSMNGDVVEGRANGVLVFTLEVNDTTGVVTLTQYEEIDHDLPGDSSNYDTQLEVLGTGLVELTGTATITDGDGDTAEETVVLDLGGNVRFADDGPAIDATVTDGDAVTLTTFDADTVGGTGVDTSTADFGGAFSVASSDFGADGAGSIAWDYSLVIDNATSGLTSDGVAVTLSMNGDVVEGRANGTLVFTVAIDDTTGVVTLTQYEEIDHDLPGSDSNYDSQLEALADGVLSISGTATITDGDGDTAEETVLLDLGGNIRFADDGPSIDASVTDGDTVTLTTQDGETEGADFDADVSTANFGGAFSVASFDYGADGAGSVAWEFSLSIVGSSGVDSGLTQNGVAIYLYDVAGEIIGSTQTPGGGVIDGTNIVFSLDVDASTGEVTLVQYQEIDHSLPGDSSNYDAQLEVLGTGLVNLTGTATITDGDGDTAEETVVLDLGGNVRFADDGPAIDATVTDGDVITLTTQDAETEGAASDTDVSTANFGGAFSIASSDYGADGAGSTAWSYSLVIDNAVSGLTSGGNPITLSMNGSEVEGFANGVLVFSVSVDASTGEVTLTQYEAIDHDLPGDSSNYDSQLAVLADGVLSLSGTATITDGDGDTAEETVVLDLGGNIRFADDGPIAVADTNTMTEDTASVVGNVVTTNADDFGADGAGNPAVTAISGFGGAGTVGGSTTGEFGTLTLNADGTYTYALNNASVQYLNDGDSETDTFTYTIIDSDGDTSTTTLTITITGSNDAPVLTPDGVFVSEEGFLANGNPDDVGTPSDNTNNAVASGQIGITDVDNSTFTVTMGIPTTPGLTSNGLPVTWQLSPDGQALVGSTTEGNVILIGIDNTGAYTVNLVGPVDHSNTSVEDVLGFSIPVSVNDGTTTTTLNGGITVVIEDDSPIIGDLTPANVTVANAQNATGTGTFDYSPGGDGHGEFHIAYTGPVIDGLDYTLTQIDSDNDGQNDGAILTASANGTDVYTLEVDVDGNYTYTLLAPDTGSSETISLLNLSAGGPGFRELEDDPATALDEDGRIEFQSNGNGVNASTQGFGVSNQWTDPGEWFTMEFHEPGNLGINDAPQTDADILTGVTLNVQQVRQGPVDFRWTVTRYNDDGTVAETETGIITISAAGDVIIPTTIEFSELRMENIDTNGTVRFRADVTVERSILPQDVTLDFEVSATDNDGDTTSVSTLSVFVDADLTLAAPLAIKSDLLVQPELLDYQLASDSTAATGMTGRSMDGSRMMARANEATAIAASAAAFAMPAIEAEFSQAYGDIASANDLMVNFEFAAASMIEAPQLPEAYAAHFGGRVEIDAMEGQDIAMAHILDDAGAFTGSRIEEAMGLDLNAVDYADPAEVFAGVPSAFEGIAMGDTGSAMEALLMLEATVPQDAAGSLVGGGSALEEAVAELHAEAQVDAVVAHFAANDMGSDEGGMLTVPVEGLLDGMVGNGNPFHAVGIVQTDQTDEAALLAATA